MALAVSVRIDIVDAKGKSSFTKIRVPTGFSITDYGDFALGMAQLIADISTGRITNVSFCISLDLAGAVLKSVASGLSDIAQKALFGFSTAATGFRTKMKVPAISELKVVAGSDNLDLVDADVSAFVSAMEIGIATSEGTVQPTDMRQYDITTLDYAREFFRKK